MNSKEPKLQKKLKKSKPLKNGEQEVFVLPPNLLQKLGINLGNVESFTNIPDAECKMSSIIPNEEYGHSSSHTEQKLNSNIVNKESSIVKTANLMKESVFLSPTFNTAIINDSISTLIGGYIDSSNAKVNYASGNSNRVFDDKINSNNISSEHSLMNTGILVPCKNSESDVRVAVKNNSIHINGSTPTEKSVVQNETNKIIKIISEETVSVAKLNELKVLQISANKMIPASLNTIIGKKSKSSISKGITDDSNIQPSVSHDIFMNKMDDIKMPNTNKNDVLKKYCNTDNVCNTDAIKNYVVDNKTNKEVKLRNEISSNDPILERKQDGLNKSVFGAACKEVTMTGNDVTDDMEKITTNNINQVQNQNIHYKNSCDIKQVNNTELEPVNDIKQNVENCSSDITNSNNNTWNHNKSDFHLNQVMMLTDSSIDDDQQNNFETNSLRSDEVDSFNIDEPDFTENPIEKCTDVILENNKESSASKKEKLLDINDDNTFVSNVSTLELEKNQSVCDTIDDEGINKLNLSLNPMRNNVMSKLCIQGVEKPGGNKTDKYTSMSLKTYSNNNKHKNIHGQCFSPETKNGNIKLHHKSNIDLNETRPTGSLNCQQFCKCCDYGRLDSDQFENNYEHIHFMSKKPLNCNPDIIFGIYDNEIENYTETRENIDHIENNDDQLEIDCDICWYNAESLQNNLDTDEDFFFLKDELPDKNSSIKINNDHDKAYNVDITKISTVNNLEPHLYVKSDVMNMNKRENECMSKNNSIHCNSLQMLNKSENNGNKLDFQNQSRKRKTSDNGAEESSKKKVKNHEDNNEISTQILVKNEVIKQESLAGGKARNSTKEQLHQDDANDLQLVKCAVCGMDVIHAEWSRHIGSKHDYIAWKEGEPSVNLENEDEVKNHLKQIVQELGQLKCNICGMLRKYAKSFLHHIISCYSSLNDDAQIPDHLKKIIKAQNEIKCDDCGNECKNATELATHIKNCVSKTKGLSTRKSISSSCEVSTPVTCGVCQENMMSHQWIEHIQKEHSYQAWREGEKPLDIKDEESIRKHLYVILQEHGPLECSKCGKSRKYVKLFLQHIRSCTGPKEADETLDALCVEWESVLDLSLNDTGTESTKFVKCGRCQQEMESKQWIEHIKENHKYISWQEGTAPLDISDEEVVRLYLNVVARRLGALVCAKCGLARKYVKGYLSHVEQCKGNQEEAVNSTIDTSELDKTVDTDSSQLNTTAPLSTTESQVLVPETSIKCGVCKKEMNDSSWITHISMDHEYIAWKETDTPIDINNYKSICQHLTDFINDKGSLKCAECGRKCKYAKGFLLHIKRCYGKTYVIEDENQKVSDMDAIKTSLEPNIEDKQDDTKLVKCGVCSQEMEGRVWLEHIHTQHNYLAWKDGDTALDLEDEESIETHLKSIKSKTGQLTCAKCGLRRRKIMLFYSHIKDCQGSAESSMNMRLRSEDSGVTVKCGVCSTEIREAAWFDHIANEHNYMAWKDGDIPLNTEDETAVKDHLYKISQEAGELVCSKCRVTHKYVKSYLQHVRGCTGAEESTDVSPKLPVLKSEPSETVTCALCHLEMSDSMWMEHIAKKHNYVSWKKNDPPLALEDEKAVRDHLCNIVQSIGSLTCVKCGLVRKYAKSYLMHIESCQKVSWKTINKTIRKVKKEKGDMVRCAVCKVEMDDTVWIDHIAAQHNYLAWRDRDPPLNVEDENDVLRHLRKIIQDEGYLECSKCSIQRKYAKLYLQHISSCNGPQEADAEMNDTMEATDLQPNEAEYDPDGSVAVKCGVCSQELVKSKWIAHIQKEHKYLAWEEGQEPIDVNDKEAVFSHLNAINAKCKGLVCGSCGSVRKYVKEYLNHVRDCKEPNYAHSKEMVQCGVCREKVAGNKWRDHAMQVHYNIAWVEGDTPINLRNVFGVDKYLKEYQELYRKLVCNICGLSRVSLAGFYAHILICGKTEEEIEKWKDMCDICNQKYLCIYKTQHAWMHRVQEMNKERKIQESQIKKEKEEAAKEEINVTPGKRRAAQKARSMIGDYAAKIACFKCKSCPFETDNREDLEGHRCLKREMHASDSDDSVGFKNENVSDEESEDIDVDSNLSNEEEQTPVSGSHKKIKYDSNSKYGIKSKFPFEVKDPNAYLQESKNQYFDLFYAKDTLFSNWRPSTYEVLPDELISKYMPELKESCKLSVSNGGWTTYKIFESKKEKGCKVLFTGGSIQCMSWAPEPTAAGGEGGKGASEACLLAVATHRGADLPRWSPDHTPAHPALLQIWDFRTFTTLPKLAYGLAHDYGTVWAMDWCPSGSRDVWESVPEGITPRLGLLAVACSNGSAYIFAVPYPDESETSEPKFYKIKPCVELRLTRGPHKYQATSINWSMFKGYTTILVGYGDGTLAWFDLATESPLLTAKDGDIHILYPYQDERTHNSSVTGLTSCLLGAWCSSSVTGSTAGVGSTAGGGNDAVCVARPVRAHVSLAASAPTFMPHWTNVLLAGDDTVGLSPSELEWGYVGRRVGAVRSIAPCVRRACIAAMVPPLLQAMRPHPAAFKGHKTIHKKNVAMVNMTPLAKKRSKHSNDDLSMKVEPITYEEAISSYGIEFKFERDFQKGFARRMQQKPRTSYPERFPLADVPALAYCPAAAHYTKLALATHAGLLLLIDV